MKKILLYALLALLTQTVNAKIWLVDNNPNSPVTLSNLQVAITDSASVGDTIMVEGSPNTYGDINITKALTIIGEGYNDPLGENSIVGFVNIRSSSVFFTGFTSTVRVIFDAFNAPGNILSNVTVERCYFNFSYIFDGGPTSNSSYLMRNIKIKNTISQRGLGISQNNGKDFILFDSLLVENNIFYLPGFSNWGFNNITGASTVLFHNNLFFNGDNGQNGNTLFYYGYSGAHVNDAIFYNNIFYDCNPSGSVNCTFMNNLTYGNGTGPNAPFGLGANDTLPGPQNNNIYGQDPSFVNYSPNTAFDFTLDFHLNTGSPCIGTGVGGTDIGIYGGAYPFNVGEGPKIPVVDFVNISNTAVPQGSTFYLQFDARVRK